MSPPSSDSDGNNVNENITDMVVQDERKPAAKKILKILFIQKLLRQVIWKDLEMIIHLPQVNHTTKIRLTIYPIQILSIVMMLLATQLHLLIN